MNTRIFVFLALVAVEAYAGHPKEVSKKFQDLSKQTKAVADRWAGVNRKKKPGIPRTRLAKLPQRFHNRTRHRDADANDLSVIPVSHLGGCGQKIRLGLKKVPKVAKIWKQATVVRAPAHQHIGFLQAPEHPGRESFSVPGAGASQTFADNGRAVAGSVNDEEVYGTVLKDGYFELGCFNDVMFKSGDKFGINSGAYKMDMNDVSIALYSELALDEDKEAMTHRVCFEFCRTIPDMVFFGINNGRTCYCTPYFQPGTNNDKKCDATCEGDSTLMCGNMEGKSSIFEMHLCDDTQTDLTEALDSAKQALDYYMETSLLAQDIGNEMQTSGAALEMMGSLSAAPSAKENGLAAKKAAAGLSQGFMSDTERYQKLLTAYRLGKDEDGADFTSSKHAIAAEHAVHNMKANMGSVVSAAQKLHEQVKLAYPVVDSVSFGDAADNGDAIAMKLQPLIDGATLREPDFRVATYAFDTTYAPAQSSCTGSLIHLPMMGLGQAGCALACEATVYPDLCVGYSFYTVTGGDDMCFMFRDINIVETYSGPEAALLQAGKAAPDPAAAYCGIKMSALASKYKPRGGWTKYDRTFGGDAGMALSQDITEYSVPDESSVTLGTVTLEKA